MSSDRRPNWMPPNDDDDEKWEEGANYDHPLDVPFGASGHIQFDASMDLMSEDGDADSDGVADGRLLGRMLIDGALEGDRLVDGGGVADDGI